MAESIPCSPVSTPKLKWLPLVLITIAPLLLAAGPEEPTGPTAEVIEVNGILDNASLSYLARAIEEAAAAGRELAIVQINSPAVVGDLAELRRVAELITDPPLPVVLWLGPAPARVGGGAAQLFSVAALRVAAPATNIDNWSPAVVGGDLDLADPPVNAGAGVLVSDPIPGLVDLVIPSTRQLLQALDGTELTVRGQTRVLRTIVEIDGGVTTIPVTFSQPGLIHRFLHLAATPEAAFFFLVAGLTLAAFEFYALGPGLAAAVASVSLLLGGYGISILPVRTWALIVAVAGIVFLVAGFQQGGVLGLTVLGTAALTVGGLNFTDGGPQIHIGLVGVVASILAVLFFFLLAMPTVGRARFSTPTLGRDHLIGRAGVARIDLTPDGVVEVDGASWPATAHREAAIRAGESVTVTGVAGWHLEVEPDREN